MPCQSGHTVTGRFYKNSVLKKVKEFYNKKSAESDVALAGIKTYKFLFVLKKIFFAVFKKLMG